MKFSRDKCPECKEDPVGIHEEVYCRANIDKQDDGSFEYSGQTDVFWDTQEAIKTPDGRIRLECDNGHDWLTAVDWG